MSDNIKQPENFSLELTVYHRHPLGMKETKWSLHIGAMPSKEEILESVKLANEGQVVPTKEWVERRMEESE